MKKSMVVVAALAAFAIGTLTIPTILAQFADDNAQTKPGRATPWRASSMTMPSSALGEPVELSVVGPADPRGRPLLILLHGRGSAPESWSRQPVPSLLEKLGGQAPVVVAVDGGESSYWHNRSTGAWESMVVDDVVPFAQRTFGVDIDRVGIAGFSMGGFGALSIAARNPDAFCVVGAHEPAIWRDGGETPDGAFDDAEDFDRHDVIAAAGAGAFDDVQLWLDRGRSDAFIAGQDSFRSALAENEVEFEFHEYDGDHSMKVVRTNLEPAFDFYAEQLARCSS